MALRSCDEQIWYWYEFVQEFLGQSFPAKKFCKLKNIDYKAFSNKLYRIVYISQTKPELYQEHLDLAKECRASQMSISKFSKTRKVSHSLLREASAHLNYLEAIEKIKSQKEKSAMNFIQIPPRNPVVQQAQVAEIVENKNEVELVISKGVKVTVAPEVGADKLIRIIELLKDL